MIFPFLLINLMSFYPYQYDINFQYTFATTAFFFYIIVMNLADMTHITRKTFATAALCAGICIALVTTANYRDIFKNTWKNRETYAKMNEILETIPDDASVRASTFLIPKLSKRAEIYEFNGVTAFGNEPNKIETDFLAFDLRPGYYGEVITKLIQEYKNEGYIIFAESENLLLILVSPDYPNKS